VTRRLVVDDGPQLLRALVLNLTNRGYEVTTASTATAPRAALRRMPEPMPSRSRHLVTEPGMGYRFQP
jgi:DNA-binding response OmpR family regulator